jgi:quercetin dioxygenase-like cupin family protein
MLLHKELKLGDLDVTIIDFKTSGDVLPKHVHDETNVHITIVCDGKIKAYSPDWEVEAISGQIVDFRVGQPHEIMALENDTRIINIVKKYSKSN